MRTADQLTERAQHMKPPTTFDPKTSQYSCAVWLDHEELVDMPWHVAYCDTDLNSRGTDMAITVTEVVAPDGSDVPLDGLDMEPITEQCRDALMRASRDDSLTYKVRAE